MKVGFVFTNYNNASYTLAAIESLCDSTGWSNFSIVVVDNDSDYRDRSYLDAIERKYDCVHIIYSDKNVGYFPGLNIGIRFLRDRYGSFDCIVIGNNDLVFPHDFYNQIVHCRSEILKYAVISPNLVTFDGFHQNPHVVSKSSISVFRKWVWKLYYTDFYLALVILFVTRVLPIPSFSKVRNPKIYTKQQVIHQGYGACYLLGPTFFDSFSELWAPTFLMNEELFLAIQLEERGLECLYEPRIVVKHHDHATNDNLPSRKKWEISRDSYAILMKELDKRRV